eukprot:CAMPEP_0177694736 /NCGR_PEP_ID=MMETSP0484_2-20121128/3089_1 /TAXON_ID=354590 /ORGANISM="Rhodomonas lens, Strain RHODO" /LENGTH=130 /DNA_ID=CAMNT_0019205627 /DNA_START=56 /DNA_END=451 /DNA_ORIENTATION=+
MVVFLILVRVQVHVMVSACVPLALACGRAFERVLAVVQQLGGDGVGVESQDLIRLRVNTSASLSSSSSDPASSSRIAPARGQEEGWSRRQGGSAGGGGASHPALMLIALREEGGSQAREPERAPGEYELA